MMRRIFVGLIVTALTVAACGGDDATTDGATDTAAAGDASGATATVRVGGNTYEFSGATDCSPEGPVGLAIRFDDGDDFVSLNQSGDIVLVRARLDGTEYADTGSPDAPVVSGSNVTWSGDLSGDGEGQAAEFSVSC